MSELRTVTLELVRHGPPHNQLLSPLTEYLALCGNHAPETVRVPFEHQQFLMRLQALDYKESPALKEMMLADTCQEITRILSQLRCLTAELAGSVSQTAAPIHLQLVLSAAELALLPFELAIAPDGSAGAGGSLTLPTPAWVCLTRQVRRVNFPAFPWPSQPRILFASALPGEGGQLIEAHLHALSTVLDPWLGLPEAGGAVDAPGPLRTHLHLLPRATLSSIEEACRRHSYTHVHILAHGRSFGEEQNRRFGIALLDPLDPTATELVSGSRLAAALRQPGVERKPGPAVVTLASCHSSQHGSVMTAGASVAHALHAAGIPLVVASQFPLTYAGSVLLTQVLYEHLLWGEDPRLALTDVRRRLRAEIPESHDWASIVAYAALPTSIGSRLQKIQAERAKAALDAALSLADASLAEGKQDADENLPNGAQEDPALQISLAKVDSAMSRLRRLARGDFMLDLLLGSAEKRRAYIYWRRNDRAEARRSLEESLRHYRTAFARNRASSWPLVQYLSLCEVLGREERFRRKLLRLALLLAELNTKGRFQRGRAESWADPLWSHGDLAEACLIDTMGQVPGSPAFDRSAGMARRQAELLALKAQDDPGGSFAVASTLRQLERYLDFFPGVAATEASGQRLALAQPIASELCDILRKSKAPSPAGSDAEKE